MSTSIIHLSQRDAERVFASPDDWDPMPVINYWKNQFTDDNEAALHQDLKFLLLVVKTYLRYKSKEYVSWFIMRLIKQYIACLYSKGQKTLPLQNLKFLEMVIFRFRNIKDDRKIKKHFEQPEFLDKLRYALFLNGGLPEYQGHLFIK